MKPIITIDIYSDTVCPWCYIGLKKIKIAIDLTPKLNFHLLWRPFQLNPNMPIKGMDRQRYLELKFGGKKNATETYRVIYEQGIENNIYFQFEKINIMPNSFASHKLLALAHNFNNQTQVLETLFYSYFIEGVDIGNLDHLILIAKQHKIYDKNTLKYLQSDEDNKNLLSEEAHAKDLGIKGVPCFIVNKEFVFFGVQTQQNFIDIFKKLQNE